MADAPTTTAADEAAADPEPDTAPSDASASQGDGGATQQDQDTFVSEADVMAKIRGNAELDHVFKRMQGSYTKAMQKAAADKEAAQAAQRFNTDPAFAEQIMRQRAAQMGLQVVSQGTQPVTPHETAPADWVESAKSFTPQEFQFMAPWLANMTWALSQKGLKPLQDQTATAEKQRQNNAYEESASALSDKVPGWEDHKDEMSELLEFLQGPEYHSRKFGSKIELLHQMATANEGATAAAVRRIGQAAKSRTVSGQTTRQNTNTLEDRIASAKSGRDKWEIARKYAAEQEAKTGSSQ